MESKIGENSTTRSPVKIHRSYKKWTAMSRDHLPGFQGSSLFSRTTARSFWNPTIEKIRQFLQVGVL